MFLILETIDKAVESQSSCTLIHKAGYYLHGKVAESWARVSGGKMRGKLRFDSIEKGVVEVDINDVLELKVDSVQTDKPK